MPKAPPFKQPGSKRKSFLESATTEYESHLDTVAPYLEGRGLPIEVARKWRLGYVAKPRVGHERFQGYLAIPYITPTGIVLMKFRCLADHNCKDVEWHEKYDAEQGWPSRMFGVLSLQQDSPVHGVCEGELDAIAASELAGIPSVAVPGVSAWKPHYPYLFEGCQKVIVFADGDDSGRSFTKKVSDSIYNDCTVVAMPQGLDVNSFVARFGGAALRDKVGLDAKRTD